MVTMTKKGCDTFAHFGAFCHCVGGEYNHHEKMNILCWKLRKMHALPKYQKFLYMDWQCSQSWHVVGNPVAHCIVNTSMSGITLLCMCVFHHLYLNIFYLLFCLLRICALNGCICALQGCICALHGCICALHGYICA